MLAEILGKISRTGSNLTERLEDNLTGNVFGVLRYIPFSAALGEVLANGVYPRSVGEEIRDIQNGFWAKRIPLTDITADNVVELVFKTFDRI
ncbi:hypothetical protein V7075_15050 [Neobacillus drentensis]|uniref:hypothetical protein n=1 Tax=Neobacillus drentensis TaxID=220684 RepID=UPI002FFD8E16